MANEKSSTNAGADRAPTALDKARRAGEAIAVSVLKVAEQSGIEIPVDNIHGSRWNRVNQILADTKSQGGAYHIEYWPWMRHFFVEYVEGKKVVQFLLHESIASCWVPLAT